MTSKLLIILLLLTSFQSAQAIESEFLWVFIDQTSEEGKKQVDSNFKLGCHVDVWPLFSQSAFTMKCPCGIEGVQGELNYNRKQCKA